MRLSKNDIHFHQHISDTINHTKKAIKENAMALSWLSGIYFLCVVLTLPVSESFGGVSMI